MRTFVAIFPPPEVQESLLRAAKSAPVDGEVRWTHQENVHLTLKFLDDTGEEALEGIRAALKEVAGRHASFYIQPSRLGAFPSAGKARVLWSGVDEGSAELAALAADVECSLEPLGFGREERVYRPHATLGRARRGPVKVAEEYVVRIPGFVAGRLDLTESVLGTRGATYRTLESYTLSGEPRVAPLV